MESSKQSLFQGASPQLTFIFGIIGGIALTSLVVLAVTYFDLGSGSKKTSNNTTTTNTTPTPTDTTTTYGDVKAVSDEDYVRGSENPKVTLIEYSDYECPFCKSFHPTMERIMDEYGDDVAWVYRHFPLSFHANAPKQAEAALCVGKLGGADKYWTFTDTLFERTTSNGYGFALTDLGPLAKEIGVDQEDFQSCLDGGEMAARVAAETADGTGAGASGTPTTFVVGEDGKTLATFPGALPYEQVKTQLDAVLAAL